MASQNRKVVLGLGNILCRDEGLGIFALRAVQESLGRRGEIEYLDGGVMGLDLLPVVEDCSHLLILDAIDAGKPPAALIELDKTAIPLYKAINLSEHQLGFQEVLGLAKIRQALPACLHLIGAQPADLSTGIGLSPALAGCLPKITGRASSVLRSWDL
jgi:hydrogenase maturation protease